MASVTKSAPATRPTLARTAEPQRASSRESGGAWWVVTQGESATVMQAADAPSADVAPGDRMIELEGPFTSEDQARSRLNRLTMGSYARRLAWLAERGGK